MYQQNLRQTAFQFGLENKRNSLSATVSQIKKVYGLYISEFAVLQSRDVDLGVKNSLIFDSTCQKLFYDNLNMFRVYWLVVKISCQDWLSRLQSMHSPAHLVCQFLAFFVDGSTNFGILPSRMGEHKECGDNGGHGKHQPDDLKHSNHHDVHHNHVIVILAFA